MSVVLRIPDPLDPKYPWCFDRSAKYTLYGRAAPILKDLAEAFGKVGIRYHIEPDGENFRIVFATPDDEHMALMHYGEDDG